MSHPALSPHPLTRTALNLAPRSHHLIAAAILCATVAYFVADGLIGIAIFSTAGTFAALAGLIAWMSGRHM